MRKISGQLISTKPVSLSRAAKLITRFAAVDNGSSPTVSLYLQRTADAFNHLVQFHNKRSKNSDVENSPDRKRARDSETDEVERSPDGKTAQDSTKSRRKKDRKTVYEEAAEENPNEDEVKDLKSEEKKKKKKKKRKSDADDSKEKSKKKRSVEAPALYRKITCHVVS